MAAEDAPVQRHFYLGGPETFRGTYTGDLTGSAFWFGRIEVASDFPAVRLVAFGDFAWVGREEKFATAGFASSAGIGASVLDGLLRFDLAHVLKGGDGTRFHIYFDGLF
jgi:outer membrane protein assembly factor BamA